MTYLDTSAALAQLLAEDVKPAATLWEQTLVASRLLEAAGAFGIGRSPHCA